MNIYNKSKLLFFYLSLILFPNLSYAKFAKDFERAGDILQIVNPVTTAMIASQEKGLGHFGIIFGTSLGIMGATKYIGKTNKWEFAKRPDRNGIKGKYNGFPSGHTTSAWSSAAYARVFF